MPLYYVTLDGGRTLAAPMTLETAEAFAGRRRIIEAVLAGPGVDFGGSVVPVL